MTGIRGTHTFKWGVEIRVNRDSTIFGIAPNGGVLCSAAALPILQSTSPPPAARTTSAQGQPLPDSLTGLLTATPYSYNIVVPAEFTPVGDKFDEAGVRREAYNFYFQDAWKATPAPDHFLRPALRSQQPHSRSDQAHVATVLLRRRGKPTSYRNHLAKQTFVVNPEPPYDKDWQGWGPRVAVDYSLSSHTVLHAGAALTTRLSNLWQENSLTAAIPFVFNPYFTAQPGIAVPFTNSVVQEVLPPAYDINGNLIFPNGRSTDAKPNTVMDLARFQDEVAALTPGHQPQLPVVYGIAKNFRNGMIGSYTAGIDHDFRDFKASASYVATAGIHLPSVFSPNSYTGADPAFAPFTKFDAAGNRIGGLGQKASSPPTRTPPITRCR